MGLCVHPGSGYVGCILHAQIHSQHATESGQISLFPLYFIQMNHRLCLIYIFVMQIFRRRARPPLWPLRSARCAVCVAVRWPNICTRKTGKAKIHENGNGAHNACTSFSICDLLQIMKGMILTFYLAKHIVNIFLKVVQFEQIYQQG